MKSINDLDFAGYRVLVRVDFNVPLNENQEVSDDTRIKATLPTISGIMEKGGKPVVMSHLGRPGGKRDDKYSLRSLISRIEELTGADVIFAEDCIGDDVVQKSKDLRENQILLLENLRYYSEETEGDEKFAEKLALNGDFYVNDAFGTAHRAHASTAVIAQYFTGRKAAGEVMRAEIENVTKALDGGKTPVTAIVGGAKVSSKIAILQNLMPRLNNLIIGGGMAYTFIKAKGGKTGKSLVEDDLLETANNILGEAEKKGVKVYLPIDSLNASKFANDARRELSAADDIDEDMMGLDVGPQTMTELKDVVEGSGTIIWNGPMGVFEMENFSDGTRLMGDFIVKATGKGAFSLVGGGDSVAAIKKYGMEDKVSYVSTGGGAMLEYLEGKELPGIKALE